MDLKIVEMFYKARLPRIYKKLCPALRKGRQGLLVFLPTNGINTPAKSTEKTLGKENYMKETLEKSQPGLFQTTTFSLRDSLVRLFSIAGKRKGFNDTRGTLFFEICRIAEIKKPRLLLLENVKGLLNHKKGDTFRIILDSLSELGYDCEWEVFNSKNFGVPHNRERVFIVGHLRGRSGQKIFPIGGIREAPRKQDGIDFKIIHNIYGGFGEKTVREFKKYSPTIRTSKGGGHLPMIVKDNKIRKITPIECERLQGFPDNWTKGISDIQRLKCLGNAVTVNVVEEIGKRIAKVQQEIF